MEGEYQPCLSGPGDRNYHDLYTSFYRSTDLITHRSTVTLAAAKRFRSSAPTRPGAFAPGEAYQFDWSYECAVIDEVTTMAKIAHMRLCHSRTPFLRAYPREAQEMVSVNWRRAEVQSASKSDPTAKRGADSCFAASNTS
jgi:hypothetical protein